jgi:hypothetical protein
VTIESRFALAESSRDWRNGKKHGWQENEATVIDLNSRRRYFIHLLANHFLAIRASPGRVHVTLDKE